MSEQEKKTVRVNLNIAESIRDFYKQFANDLGTNMSAVMIMALKSYMDQQKGLNIGGNLKGMLDDLKKLQEMAESQQIK
jgi:hypothetical protein